MKPIRWCSARKPCRLSEHRLDNEKHAPLPQSLPRSNSCPGFVEAGDVMLWQGDTIVVFYERFDSAYSDTSLGKICETEKLKAAVSNVR
ncbi:cyclophilin-like fold protein [Neisseria dentiae]|uniref:cyclophilin-like fold protein n=1 Tax=Neisseria dentiae TaxID=194197 RepID=UPI00117FCFBB|nr:cyclophilin-like fold protein [Neisseria dentiae]QMT44279.1 hypothetical protein H3L92_07230 [Neisseria dentiae]